MRGRLLRTVLALRESLRLLAKGQAISSSLQSDHQHAPHRKAHVDLHNRLVRRRLACQRGALRPTQSPCLSAAACSPLASLIAVASLVSTPACASKWNPLTAPRY